MKNAKALEIHVTVEEVDQPADKAWADLIVTDCIPSTGDYICLEGVWFQCVQKIIEMEHNIANVTLRLKRGVVPA